jgi:hypothetical protein
MDTRGGISPLPSNTRIKSMRKHLQCRRESEPSQKIARKHNDGPNTDIFEEK